MAKTVLLQSSYVFNPGSQQVDFGPFADIYNGFPFDFTRLYAIINVTAGQIIYATSGHSSFLNGSYSDPILTLAFDTTPMSPSDQLQIIYDLQNAPTAIYDGTGTQPILSTTDPITGREGLDINLLSSSFGGQLNWPLPSYTTSGYNAALSMGFINGGNLVAPNMDPMTNNLKVDIDNFAPSATIPVSINASTINVPMDIQNYLGSPLTYANPLPQVLVNPATGSALSIGGGSPTTNTLNVINYATTVTGLAQDYGPGSAGVATQRVVLPDTLNSGPSGVSTLNTNILSGGTSATAIDGYRFATIQIISSATGGAYSFECSNDNSTFFNIPVYNSMNPSSLPITGPIAATASNILYQVPLYGRFFRVRISTALTGGTVQSYTRYSQVVPPMLYNSGAAQSNPTLNPSVDVLNTPITASKYNQLEIDFNTVPSASFITTTTAGGATIAASNGHTLFTTGTATTASAKAVTVASVVYRPGNEIYAYFTASFTTPTNANSYQRIGMYDTNNGFFIGYNGLNFGITKRTSGSDTFTVRTSFNGDLLDGSSSSKFTRNGIPEAINLTLGNLFRIRFAWLGSASILFDVMSPDGVWVNFHTIKYPNSSVNPSIAVHDLPITLDVAKTASDATSLVMATACWAGGTTSPYSPITATLTDNTLANITRSVITGVTTGGGGGYVNVKVNPSGALVADVSNSTGLGISSSVLPTGAATETTLSAINTKLPALGSALIASSVPVNIAADQNVPVYNISTGASGSISAASGVVTASVPGYSGCAIDIRGTFVATITFQGSIDGINWLPLNATPYGSAQNVALVSTTTTPGAWLVQCAGCLYVRANATAYTSGTITVVLKATNATGWVYSATTGTTNPVTISSGTVTTVSTVTSVTTVASVTAANLGSALVTDIASSAQTGNLTSGNITTLNTQAATFGVYVTALNAGTILDVTIQETLDSVNYYTIYQFERISAVGQYYSPCIKLSGSGLRYLRNVSGGTPSTSITNSVNRISRSGQAETMRRFIDRTIDPNTLNSTTGSYFCDGVEDFNLIVRCTAQTTPATIALEFSQDNANWFTSSATLTTANGIAQAKITNEQWKFVRAKVTAAGTGITLDSATIGGHSA